jgi:hypothetical protein
MFKNISTLLGTLFLIMFSASAWRLSVQYGDLSLLFLIPITFVVFWASRHLMLNLWDVKYNLVVKKNSFLAHFFHGRVRANVISAGYAIVTVITLCAVSISSSYTYLVAILICSMLASFCYLVLKRLLSSQLNNPFNKSFAITYGIVGATVLSFAFLSHVAFSIDKYDGFLLNASLYDCIEYSLKVLPDSDSILALPLSLFLIFDMLKLWLTIQLNEYGLIARALAIDIALVSFVISRLSISITYFVEEFNMRSAFDDT